MVGATLVGGETAEAAGVTGVVGAWEELSLEAPPDEGVAAADWLRELRRRRGTEVKTEDINPARLHVSMSSGPFSSVEGTAYLGVTSLLQLTTFPSHIIFLHMFYMVMWADAGVCVFCLTWMRSCWWLVLHCPASWQVLVLLALPDLLGQTQTNQRGSKFISDSLNRKVGASPSLYFMLIKRKNSWLRMWERELKEKYLLKLDFNMITTSFSFSWKRKLLSYSCNF